MYPALMIDYLMQLSDEIQDLIKEIQSLGKGQNQKDIHCVMSDIADIGIMLSNIRSTIRGENTEVREE